MEVYIYDRYSKGILDHALFAGRKKGVFFCFFFYKLLHLFWEWCVFNIMYIYGDLLAKSYIQLDAYYSSE